jgi:hypothetical protein
MSSPQSKKSRKEKRSKFGDAEDNFDDDNTVDPAS